jgi:hypothetical protein
MGEPFNSARGAGLANHNYNFSKISKETATSIHNMDGAEAGSNILNTGRIDETFFDITATHGLVQ